MLYFIIYIFLYLLGGVISILLCDKYDRLPDFERGFGIISFIVFWPIPVIFVLIALLIQICVIIGDDVLKPGFYLIIDSDKLKNSKIIKSIDNFGYKLADILGIYITR